MTIDSVSYGVSTKVVKPFAMEVTRIRGFNNSANDRWLLLYDVQSVAEITGAPKRAYRIYNSAPFDVMVEQSPLVFKYGCVAVVSSTYATYTAAADTITLFVTGQSSIDDSGWTEVGDITAVVGSLAVFDNSAIKKLVRLRIKDLDGNGHTYVCLTPTVEPDADSKIHPEYSFLVPFEGELDLFSGDGIAFENGLTIRTSNNPSVYNADADVAMLATYK